MPTSIELLLMPAARSDKKKSIWCSVEDELRCSLMVRHWDVSDLQTAAEQLAYKVTFYGSPGTKL